MRLGFSLALGAQQRAGGGGAPAFDPEAGLTLTSEVAVGSVISMASPNIDTSRPVVLAATFTGLTPSGFITELGGAATGAVATFIDSKLYLASGSFSFLYYTLTAPANAVSGNGTLVVELVPGGVIRAWWNGTALHALPGTVIGGGGSASPPFGIAAAGWAGVNDGIYMGALPASPNVFPTPNGLADFATVTPVATASPLRHYRAQTVTA